MELELRSQKIWGWKIATYLFLGGLGGGCYLVGVLFDIFSSTFSPIGRAGVFLGSPIVLIGSLFLVADLGRPTVAVRAFFRPSTSWISRGTLILLVFIILGMFHIAFWIWPFDWLAGQVAFRKYLEGVNGFFALLTVIYTGLLLGALRPIAIWSSPLLPVLFLASGLSTAIMTIGLWMTFWNLNGPGLDLRSMTVLAALDAPLILVEGLLVFFYMQGSHLLEASRASVHKMIKGDLAPVFWMLFVCLGLVLPFLSNSIELVSSPPNIQSLLLLTTFISVPGLIGGYFLRYLIVKAGIKVPLNVEGIIFLPNPET
jgi:formate-dependent nitrite reductase membrane component NrfD